MFRGFIVTTSGGDSLLISYLFNRPITYINTVVSELHILLCLCQSSIKIRDGKNSITRNSWTANFVCPESNGVFPAEEGKCSGDYYLCVDDVAYPQVIGNIPNFIHNTDINFINGSLPLSMPCF